MSEGAIPYYTKLVALFMKHRLDVLEVPGVIRLEKRQHDPRPMRRSRAPKGNPKPAPMPLDERGDSPEEATIFHSTTAGRLQRRPDLTKFASNPPADTPPPKAEENGR